MSSPKGRGTPRLGAPSLGSGLGNAALQCSPCDPSPLHPSHPTPPLLEWEDRVDLPVWWPGSVWTHRWMITPRLQGQWGLRVTRCPLASQAHTILWSFWAQSSGSIPSGPLGGSELVPISFSISLPSERACGQSEKMERCWHLRSLIWALLSDLMSPDGLGMGVQVEVGEGSPGALQAFLPNGGTVWRTQVVRGLCWAWRKSIHFGWHWTLGTGNCKGPGQCIFLPPLHLSLTLPSLWSCFLSFPGHIMGKMRSIHHSLLWLRQ